MSEIDWRRVNGDGFDSLRPVDGESPLKLLKQILGVIAIGLSAAGFIALAVVYFQSPDCTHERSTSNYTWPRSCGQ